MGNSFNPLIEYYEKSFELHGDTPQGFAWPNSDDAITRHKVMYGLKLWADQNGRSHIFDPTILDFGCGSGHFYQWLKETNKPVKYSGVDLSSKFIEVAKQKWPEVPFYCADIANEADRGVIPPHDFVVCNGVFTVKCEISTDQMKAMLRNTLRYLWMRATFGLAFNVMSKDIVEWEREDLHYESASELTQFLRKHLSRHIVIRSDYNLYESTYYVYR